MYRSVGIIYWHEILYFDTRHGVSYDSNNIWYKRNNYNLEINTDQVACPRSLPIYSKLQIYILKKKRIAGW